MRHPTLALADVHRATTVLCDRVIDIFIFDHHRTAFTLWCDAASRLGRPLTLLTFDRHFDFEPPPREVPDRRAPLEALDAFARHALAPTNDNHIRAAMEAGALDDAFVVARSHEPADLASLSLWSDAKARPHRLSDTPSLSRRSGAFDVGLEDARDLVLDIDLDCFTTRSDAHADEVLVWDRELIESFLLPSRTEAFWESVRRRIRVVTIAREPFHTGGFRQAASLWLEFAPVFFERVLGVPAP